MVSDIGVDPLLDKYVGRVQKTVTVADGSATGETSFEFNGIIKQVIWDVPELTDVNSAELKILDEDDNEIYASGERAENTKHTLTFERAVCGSPTLEVTQNVAQSGADASHTVVIYYI
jgi:hypothetical protein